MSLAQPTPAIAVEDAAPLLAVNNTRGRLQRRYSGAAWRLAARARRRAGGAAGRRRRRQVDIAEGDLSGPLKTEDGEVTRGEIIFGGERIDRLAPEAIVRRGLFQVMEGRRIVEDMTPIENLRLGAYTPRDPEVRRDIGMVFDYFPRLKERSGLAGYLSGGEQQMLAILVRGQQKAGAMLEGVRCSVIASAAKQSRHGLGFRVPQFRIHDAIVQR